MRGLLKLAAGAILVGGLLAVPPSVLAKDRQDVRIVGACSRASTSELKLSSEDARIEVEFEVDQNRAGVRWTVVVRRNGRVVQRAVKVTRRPSGSFTARLVTGNSAGAERFTATATRVGESCRAAGVF